MNFYDMRKFGNKVREIREKRGMTRDDIVDRCGIGKRTLAYLENGDKIPKLETLQLLSIVLKVDLLTIFLDYRYVQSSGFRSTITDSLNKTAAYDYQVLVEDFNLQIDESANLIDKSTYLLKNEIAREMAFLRFHCKYSDGSANDVKSVKFYESQLKDAGFRYLDHEHFDYLDFRLVLMYIHLNRSLDNFEITYSYLELFEKELEASFITDEEKLDLKLLLNIAYVFLFHRTNQYELIPEYCHTGLQLCEDKKQMRYWPSFKFRLIVAKYNLNDDSYKEDVCKLIMFMYSTNQTKILKAYLKSFKNQYPEIYKYLISLPWCKDIIDQH